MKKIRIVNRKKFFLNIILPTFMTAIMFIVLIFAIIIPYINDNLIEAKKEMIKEIVNSAMCIADEYYKDALEGKISFEEAEALVINTLKSIRYGTDNKDYIWITDDEPTMIMHPYKSDLVGKNVANYKDPNGKLMFLEMVSVAKQNGEGYVYYMWQWMDDSTKIVPKISFIKENENWGWLIGTGVYIEDIRISIAKTISYLIWTSLGIFFVISFLLFVTVKRNLMVERKRSLAEQNLKESNEKYKTLVEASGDSTLMFINGKCIFANRKIKELISDNAIENIEPTLVQLIAPNYSDDLEQINEYLQNNQDSLRLETKIINKENESINVLISFSKIKFAGSEGIIVIIKDLSIQESKDAVNLLLNDILHNTSEKLNIGVFRALPVRKGKIVTINNNLLSQLAYSSFDDIANVGMFELFDDSQERKEFISALNTKGFVKEFLCRVRKKDGNATYLLVSAVNVKGKDNSIEYIDGISIDYSRHRKSEERQQELLSLLINNASLWDLQVNKLSLKEIPYCSQEISIKKALELMEFYSTDVLLIKEFDLTGKSEQIFIFCKSFIFNKINLSNFSFEQNISQYLQTPDELLAEDSTALECILNMLNKGNNYVLIKENSNIKLIQLKDLLQLFNSNQNFLVERLNNAISINELIEIHRELPIYISNYVKAGTDISIITSTITSTSDTITNNIISQAISQCGEPPCKFAFIALGSEGRSEQGLATDQDNALIFEDFPPPKLETVQTYFHQLALIINNLLNKVGYKLCAGQFMANNPKWCQSLFVWKQYFNNWIKVPEPQSLLDSSIFFDFRCIYGEHSLSIQLREHINTLIKQNPAFLKQHALLTVNYKLPVSMFGKIHTETTVEQSNVFNLKNAIRLLVNMSRLYSMKHSISETNTLKRLEIMANKNYISQSFFNEIQYCFKFLMNMQFQEQTNNYLKGYTVDNYLDLSILSPIKLSNLKNVLSSISQFQSKVKYDFGVSENM